MSDTQAGRAAHFHPSDGRALARLLTDATTSITHLVEAVHIGVAPPGNTGGIAPLTYRAVRGVARYVGRGAEATLGQLEPLFGERAPSPERRAALAGLNGVLGDYLLASGSPLAKTMTFRHRGEALALERAALAVAFPAASDRLLVLVHGLCMDDNAWEPGGFDTTLAGRRGYTPLALDYNSGRHISTNGRELAGLLEALVTAWPRPVTELAIVAHSMGGLVVRSACHYGAAAGHAWPTRLGAVVYLGTPHHGAPMERGGNWINVLMGNAPYAGPFARLGRGRSAGITDLRYGNLLDEDWNGRDRFAHTVDTRAIVPLPAVPRHYAVAATLRDRADSPAARLLGDGLVPLDSALGRHADPARCLPFDAANSLVVTGVSHLDLLRRAEVAEQVAAWLSES